MARFCIARVKRASSWGGNRIHFSCPFYSDFVIIQVNSKHRSLHHGGRGWAGLGWTVTVEERLSLKQRSSELSWEDADLRVRISHDKSSYRGGHMSLPAHKEKTN